MYLNSLRRSFTWLFAVAAPFASLLLLFGDSIEYQTLPAATRAELTPSAAPPITTSGVDWPRSNGDNASTRYSSLVQINRLNVKKLTVAWTYHSGDGKGNIEANPVIVDGVVFGPTPGHALVAIDGFSGEEIWRFHPEGRPALRGLVYWPGDSGHAARLYFASGDWVYAIDAKAGKPSAEFGRDGRVPARAVVAPAIFNNVLILPCWNEVRGFDVLTGSAIWTFNLLARAEEFGGSTWTGPGYGANSWGGMALDAERGIAYVSAGSPHPNYLGMHHHGDNLFSDCVVALRALTGELIWHFQEVRHDIWDLDLPAAPNLVSVVREGRKYDAVAQVTKLGNTLLLDRLTGKPLFPFRLRHAPGSKLAGEQTAEWQPDLEIPQPFAPQVFRREDVTDLSPESKAFVLSDIEKASFGWFAAFEDNKPLVFYGMHGGAEWTGASFDPQTNRLYINANKLPWVVTIAKTKLLPQRKPPLTGGNETYLQYCAGCHGRDRDGYGAGAPLYTAPGRLTRQQVISAIRKGRGAMPPVAVPPQKVKALLDFLFERDLSNATLVPGNAGRSTYRFVGYHKLLDQDGRPGVKPPWGTLNAINLNTGRIAWRVPLGTYDDLLKKGLPPTGTENFGGASATAGGLVFCAGTRDLKIRAFNSDTGEQLWEYRMPAGGFAPPAIYQAHGREFVIIAATGGGKLGKPLGDTYIAFALPQTLGAESQSRRSGVLP